MGSEGGEETVIRGIFPDDCVGSLVTATLILMPEAYDDAAMRHYHDAERLAGAARYDNASHLIGFAAECALKHHFGITMSLDSPKTHLPDLAVTLRKRFSARNPQQATMRGLLDQFGGSFFADWHVNKRYFETGHTTQKQYFDWREQARRALGVAGLRLSAEDQA